MDLENIKDKIVIVRGQQTILDSDVAMLYGVETKRVNEAVKNNPDKFPEGYIIYLSNDEADSLRSKFSTLKNPGRGGHSKYSPKAFTEKALYMIATILKSPKATETTISIIETFAKVRELSRNISELHQQEDNNTRQSMLQKSGEIIADIISSDFETTDTETTVELNLAILSVKHTIKRKPKK
ncbi:ORF6N domain-containing protein [Dysgonomonas termitidis]|uniref:ORF6N domain-containing protein n=1 Tax=Dysgonomonas termitidis TaxID=1516126 RepID=A0ABV9KTV9_9BACT